MNCSICNEPLEPGTPIAWRRKTPATKTTSFYHIECHSIEADKAITTKAPPSTLTRRPALVTIDEKAIEEMERQYREETIATLLQLIADLDTIEHSSFLYPTNLSQERRELIDRIAHLARQLKEGANG